MKRVKKELLERIKDEVGCEFISDLHFGKSNEAARAVFENMDLGSGDSSPHCLSEYSPYEVSDAKEYIYAEKREQKPLCTPKNF